MQSRLSIIAVCLLGSIGISSIAFIFHLRMSSMDSSTQKSINNRKPIGIDTINLDKAVYSWRRA